MPFNKREAQGVGTGSWSRGPCVYGMDIPLRVQAFRGLPY